ncbi:MAG TPA: type 1 glutamine amidotransferase domain-containing protein [Bacillales bacterium]|nr:type 1 glutamine amidotransferase domain-containing protein [Bacillales bacterium]
MAKKIAVVLTDLFEDVEYTDPAKAYQDAGHEMTVIEKEKGKTLTGKNGEAEVTVDASIDEVKPEDFDALLIPGGFSPDQLRADDRFVDFAGSFMSTKKPVFAICHGPQLLITARSLEGRKATGFKSIQVDLDYAGADLHDEEVVNCGDQLITSRQPDDIPAFNKETLRILN